MSHETPGLFTEMAQSAEAKRAEKIQRDPVQGTMGGLGRWQICVCAVVFLLKFPVAWHQMGIIFLAPKPEFVCQDSRVPPCDTSCQVHVFNTSVFTNTLQMEFDLVCDRQGLTSLSQTIFMLGILVGNMFFGGMADRLGRRIPLVIAVIVQLVFGVASSYATNFWLFVIFRFFTAAATGGTMVTS